MKIRLLMVAEIEVPDQPEPTQAALSQILDLGEQAKVEFYEPAVGRTLERAGCRCVEVFY